VAVNNNPYEKWEELKASSDYRSTDTQITSLVRQQLSQPDYLRTSNRVNPGPLRNSRAQAADSKPQIPHPLGSEDMWGWQQWTQVDPSELQEPAVAENLLEANKDAEVPGKTYDPIGEVGGAST
jgi:hypothetical protein